VKPPPLPRNEKAFGLRATIGIHLTLFQAQNLDMSQSSPPTGVKCPCGEYWGSSAGGSFAVVSQHDQESLIAGQSDVATCGAQFDHILSTGSGPASSLDWVYDRMSAFSVVSLRCSIFFLTQTPRVASLLIP
jgi:hypothetical protein